VIDAAPAPLIARLPPADACARLRAAVAAAGISHAALGRALGRGRVTIARRLHGHQAWPPAELDRVRAILAARGVAWPL
jgi:ParB-like chromosome segregation protein Spo0J